MLNQMVSLSLKSTLVYVVNSGLHTTDTNMKFNNVGNIFDKCGIWHQIGKVYRQNQCNPREGGASNINSPKVGQTKFTRLAIIYPIIKFS